MAGCVFLFLAAVVAAQQPLHPPVGARLHYLVFSGRNDLAAPFATVDFVYGPDEGKNFRWWELEVRATTNLDASPLFVLRALTSADPLGERQGPVKFSRYQLRIPETGETDEYVDSNTGRALLPAWAGFERYFLPHPAPGTGRTNGAPQTCEFLGQLLSLVQISAPAEEAWSHWDNVKRLDLNPEILVGNDRDFKDREGHRLALPTTNDYTYIPLTEEDYRTAFAAGMNLFPISAKNEQWVRSEPVFYFREAAGAPVLRYPADLYRANYLGSAMLIDEPAGMILDRDDRRRAGKYAADFSTLFEMRTRSTYWSGDSYGAWHLETMLHNRGVNFGDMRLLATNIPTWDSYAEAAYYEMKAGVAGIVQEGRYNTAGFDYQVAAATGLKLHLTAVQMLKFNYALMRGGVRPFGKSWGTSIYGQCDPALAPLGLTTAYDMGARYFWFWTSDHQHHVPWNEQMALARALKDYAAAHPRPSLALPAPKRDAVILIPNGYFLSLRDFQWDAGQDRERHEAGEKYRRVLTRALLAVKECFDRDEDFDIAVNDGRPPGAYRRVIKIDDEMEP